MRGEQSSSLLTAAQGAVSSDRLRVEFCYCSVFDQCWQGASDEIDPTPVRVCARDDDAEFEK